MDRLSLKLFTKKTFLALLIIFFCAFVWLKDGIGVVDFDTDFARDLMEISNISQGDVVWLGPWLQLGFNTSPSYYYFFYPAVELGSGHPVSMVLFNILIASSSVGLFSWLAMQRFGKFGALAGLILGLSPWLMQTSLHPGNGYTYALFTLLALTSLYFQLPLFLSSLFVGMASSFHPAGFLLLPFWLWSFWERRRQLGEILLSLLLFLSPWAPLIGFEVITKGLLIRTFLSQPQSAGIYLSPSFANLQLVAQTLGIHALVLLMLLFVGLYKSKDLKLGLGLGLGTLLLILISLLSELETRYIFSLAILIQFSLVLTLIRFKPGKLILVIWGVWLVLISPLFNSRLEADRTITQVVQVVDSFEAEFSYLKDNQLAVVGALSKDTPVPQADDYRALLRFRGFQVAATNANNQADYLVMFIETPDINWETWINYEIGLFGEKQLVAADEFGSTKVFIFEKVD